MIITDSIGYNEEQEAIEQIKAIAAQHAEDLTDDEREDLERSRDGQTDDYFRLTSQWIYDGYFDHANDGVEVGYEWDQDFCAQLLRDAGIGEYAFDRYNENICIDLSVFLCDFVKTVESDE